ncbi:MAG TPA: molybdopterin-binding protein [Clostridiales bacterium]|nr:molybdopterin-binding protein [Clostridiales bacterium]
MKLIKTEDAVGHVLCHDMTQIIKGVTKDAIFRKGHIVTEEDIPVLLSIGKDHLYIWEKEEGMLHENEGAEILCSICKGENIKRSDVKEGKIDLYAECDGLFKVNLEVLNKINALEEMMIATRHGNFPVKQGDKLAGTRIIPLVIEEEKMQAARDLAGDGKVLEVKPFLHKKAGIVTTGNEVYYGRIKDEFTPVIVDKLGEYDAEILEHVTVNDDPGKITEAILNLIKAGADLILCTGGMSVDPDDKTPLAIKNTGARIVTYGAPVLPGAMFLLSYYKENIPVVGLPGCVMYSKRTIFDLMLPRIMAGEIITREEISKLGHGGLCLSCKVCTYPNCGFGKGM